MVNRSARRKSFRVQPVAHIGNFSIRIVDPDIKKRPGRGFAFRGVEQNRARIEFFQARTKIPQGTAARRQKIGLTENEPVGHGRLLHRLLMRIEGRVSIYRIDQGDDAVDTEPQHEIGMRHDRVQNRRRVGKASRFDHDPLK